MLEFGMYCRRIPEFRRGAVVGITSEAETRNEIAA
jgi:hypothetical protein